MQFSHEEKLAVVKITTDVIKADGELLKGELKFLEQLKKTFGFDIPTVEKAEDIARDNAIITLNKLSSEKKIVLAQILNDVAISDNFLHEKETELIEGVFAALNIKNQNLPK